MAEHIDQRCGPSLSVLEPGFPPNEEVKESTLSSPTTIQAPCSELPLLSNLPKHIPTSTSSVYTKDDVLCLIPSLLKWSPGPTEIVQITGGMTNIIYKLTHVSYPSVIVRVFDSIKLMSPDARYLETLLVTRLSHAQLAPTVQAVFANGRVEGYLEGRHPSLEEMKDRKFMSSLAHMIVRLHAFQPPDTIGEAVLNSSLREWRSSAANLVDEGRLPMDMVQRAEKGLEEWQRRFDMNEHLVNGKGIVFTHNDLIPGNLIVHEDGEVSLIDFEYSGWNFRAFELANFFSESCGGTDTEDIRVELYPSRELRKWFCEIYLSKSEGKEVSDEAVEEFLGEVELFDAYSNLMWGFWAMVKCCEDEVVNEDWLRYAQQRLHACYSRNSWA